MPMVDRNPPRPPDVPRDVTVPLLTRITEESLDQDYRLAAQRKKGLAPPQRSTGRPALIALAVCGLLVGTAGAQAASSEQDVQGERSGLLSQIENRRERLADQQEALTDLRAETRNLESELASIAQVSNSADGTIRRLDVAVGLSPVSGPGLRIVVDDPVGAEGAELVRADDLGILLDGLWNAGAEAISIDDQRITALTALRNSGTSIGVNRVPLQAPYTVRAVGNPQTLQANLLDSTSGLTWQSLVDQLEFRVKFETVEDMTLPAGRLRTLQAAEWESGEVRPDRSQESRP